MNNKQFEKCINYIQDERVKKSALVLVGLLPTYFFEIPASSTGKYHPEYSLGFGGLLRHTKAAFKIANDLVRNLDFELSEIEKDLSLLAIMLHDGFKSGYIQEKYTRADHPHLAADFVINNKALLFLSDEEIIKVADAIRSHSGRWTTDYQGNEILPKPETNMSKFVHLCDYLASRKYLAVDINDL